MKEECRFIGREIMDIIEDVGKIEDSLVVSTTIGGSLPYINQRLDAVTQDARSLANHGLIRDTHYQVVEQAVKRAKSALPAESTEFDLLVLPRWKISWVAGGIQEALLNTLMESVVECECT